MSRQRTNASPSRRRKIVTTVNLEPDVVDYLRELQAEFDRDRSYLVNAMVKDFRRRRAGGPAVASGLPEAFPKQLTA